MGNTQQQEHLSRIELLIGIAESKRLGPDKAKELLDLVREAVTEAYARGEIAAECRFADSMRKRKAGC